MTVRILEPDDFPASAVDTLKAIGPVTFGPPDEAVDLSTRVLFVRLAARVDRDFHRRFPQLQWIVSPTTGLNHIDQEYFAAHGVQVVSLRGRTEFLDTIHATAEHTLGLALALLRDLPGAAGAVRAGRWDRYPHKGAELFGKRVLIWGYGRIGRLVAPLYRAFGCKVAAHDIVPGRVPSDMACRFPEALSGTDILSLHLPLNAETTNLVSSELLALLPPTAIVINTARGEVLDQAALLEMLEAGSLAGAALDVLNEEPAPLTPALLERFNALGRRLIVTPHIGGFTTESLESVERFMADVLLAEIRAGT